MCDCGNRKLVRADYISNGKAKHCNGPIHKTKHGLYKDPVYKIWVSLRHRCNSKNSTAYDRYGGRGINLYPDWENNPQAFIDYVGNRPSVDYSIDRIHNDKGYEPGNVKWSTRREAVLSLRPETTNEMLALRLVAKVGKIIDLRYSSLKHGVMDHVFLSDEIGWCLWYLSAISHRTDKPIQPMEIVLNNNVKQAYIGLPRQASLILEAIYSDPSGCLSYCPRWAFYSLIDIAEDSGLDIEQIASNNLTKLKTVNCPEYVYN